MKKILYTLIIICLTACQQDEQIAPQGEGYLSFSSITLQTDTYHTIYSRTVDTELHLEILDANDNVITAYSTGSSIPSKIALETGTYTLKAYSDSYTSMPTWTNEEKGEKVFFFHSVPFEIESEKITPLSIQVPMINVGVQLLLPEDFHTLFSDYAFTVTMGERAISLKEGETAFFPYNEEAKISFQLSATNTDHEQVGPLEGTYPQEGETIMPGILYTVTYKLPSRSLSIFQ